MHEIIVKTSIQAEIDQYGRCDENIKQETKIKNYSKKIIEAIIQDLPDDSLHMTGAEFELLITAPAEKTVVTSNEKIVEFLGVEKFLELAQVPIESLKQWLNPEQFTEVTTTVKGSRSFKAKRKMHKTDIPNTYIVV